jgi:hypothetical protein
MRHGRRISGRFCVAVCAITTCDPGEIQHPFRPGCCLLPSPWYERLGSPKHLSADNVSRLLRLLIVAARWFALPPYGKAFDTPLSPVGSLLPVGVCYRALRRLPGQDFHLQEQRVLQDAPSRHGIKAQKHLI